MPFACSHPTGSQQQFQQRHHQRREVMQDATVHSVCHPWHRPGHCPPCAVPRGTDGRIIVSQLDLNIQLRWPGSSSRGFRGLYPVIPAYPTATRTRAIGGASVVGDGIREPRYAGLYSSKGGELCKERGVLRKGSQMKCSRGHRGACTGGTRAFARAFEC